MTQVEELLQSARSAVEAGNQLVARGYLRRASRLAPDRLDIWQALLEVTERPEDRLRCLEQIVRLAPDDTEAAAALDQAQAQLAAAQAQEKAEQVQHADEAAKDATPALQEGRPVETALPPPVAIVRDMRPDVTDEMREAWDRAAAAGQPLFCIDHPETQTSLRCNRCGAPVCTSCIVRTPVGFRCKACVRAQQSSFFTAHWYDYVIALGVATILSIPAGALASLAGWWFAIIVSPVAGGLIGGLVHRAVGRRRGKWTWLAAGAGIVVGALGALSLTLFFWRFDLISVLIYAVTATGAAVGILRMGGRRR